ncbi:bifunctional diaminohydroxyphosphoribosylaminopyrimidine deaminase/5-amino-6-(5-phosphoribosylamino)uracil reductase RibD [Micrococcus luteus]|uniref:bifunctional diaminohydroxyphosphoribosylaminopyrimidine deaminase/5-amino-6-(5-phosphoribosylamino)uracil reductase RibD n=1 Tax=Micrococcus TaxID=1269 RepID=UPI0005CC1122|nr:MULTISPECIES: bifunctional diaminohydroxyphosphoribosylaminopyrimidine deaminase/5-amino-6-(5-phosphoribosylamino)uracil reductase RibD [Micrococcus]MBM4624471.1 bifunctional diaminohydroxyphosphoribosylaminopyrimidine deaminase/5-amino-6-(5-phosphoribosylamino)uracil reductase RibD [Micrococcus sp. JV4]MCD0184250.1 bifunctional diaminohydroxyphosphoribosylaminopyrimidine deaminase/5-amino-6-(5-phosphoribosylamino)uracil reductase RibD [Micrococcus luteus]MCT1811448.1 bifunctional diaminohydr
MSAAETPSADPMDLAVRAALRGVRGANPLVGAVLTDEAGRVLAVGHHRGRGTAHAEVDALTRWRAARATDPALAALDPAGLTLHVTLEPCDHTGSTGPCSQAVLDAGIGALRYAVADPTGHDGGGAARLAAHGVHVTGPTGEAAALTLTARWREVRDAGRPWVTGHLAQSLDGHAAAADGTSQWITGPDSRVHAHEVRSRVDAIVVGTGTVLADDPRLTARDAVGAELAHQPVPVVQGHRPVPDGAALRTHPVVLEVLDHDPHAVLAVLAAHPGPWPHGRRAEHVLIEGGPRVLGAWLRASLVDELMVYTAPLLLGPGRAAVAGLDVATLSEGLRWHPDPAEGGPVRALGVDVWTHLSPVPAPRLPTAPAPTRFQED